MAICPSNSPRDCPLISKTLKKNQIPAYDTFGPFPDETILSSIDRVLFFLGVRRVQRYLNLPTPCADDSSSECSQTTHRSQKDRFRSCCAIESLGQLENVASTVMSKFQTASCQTSKIFQPEEACQTSKMFQLGPENGCQTSQILQQNAQTSAQTSNILNLLRNSQSFDPSEALKSLRANPSEALKALHASQVPLSFSQSARSSRCTCPKCCACRASKGQIPPPMSNTHSIRSMLKNSGVQMLDGRNGTSLDGDCCKKVTLPCKRSFSLCSLASSKIKQTSSNVCAKYGPAKWIWSRLQCYSDGTKIYEIYKNTSVCSNPADIEVGNNPSMIFVVMPNNCIVPFESVECND